MPLADQLLLTLMLKNALLEKKGHAFEDFFVQAAIALWGDDFEPWKPQGRAGDFKCDGYLVSEQTVFQCNAPEQFKASTVAGKIQDDFEGARTHFGASMTKWIFVHNQKDLPAKAALLLIDLRLKYPDIELVVWTTDHIMTRLLTLPREGLLNLFPTLAVELKFSPDILDKVKGWLDEINPPLALEAEDKFLANRNALHDALEDLNQVDQEVRRRLLGYSKWFDPANKIEIYARIAAAGYDADIVENNAQRLAESHLITITDIYLLPQDNEVCQIAAESLITEFLRDLEVG